MAETCPAQPCEKECDTIPMTESLFGELPGSSSQFDRTGPNAPFAWYGGKAYYAEWLINQFPEHRVYIEPFGGAGNIILRKYPHDVEVFNDLDGRIVNFFRVLRDRNQLEELIRKLQLTPYSREEFSNAAEEEEPDDPVEKARWFFVRLRQALGGSGMGKVNSSYWAASIRSRRKMAEPVSKYLSAIDGLESIASRMATVLIEHMPAIKLIQKYDAEDAFFYCDPPYVPETRNPQTGTRYGQEMTIEDHVELLATLSSTKGKVAISGYRSEVYEKLLQGWRNVSLTTKSRMSNSGQPREEILWCNW